MNWIEQWILLHPQPVAPVIPARFAGMNSTEAIESPAIRRAVEKYVGEFMNAAPKGIGCLFIGKAGTYKSTAAYVLLHQVWKTYQLTGLVIQCPIVLNRFERNRYSPITEKDLAQLRREPLLVMDDFSQITPGGYQAGILLELAEARYSEMKPTIWTGNIAVSEPSTDAVTAAISSLYGPSFGRRVVEGSEGFRVLVR